MPQVGFKPTTSVYEQAKRGHIHCHHIFNQNLILNLLHSKRKWQTKRKTDQQPLHVSTSYIFYFEIKIDDLYKNGLGNAHPALCSTFL
jgi:hypothetical protein